MAAQGGGGGNVVLAILSGNTNSVPEDTVLFHQLSANKSVTWSLVGGADQARFELSGSVLRWASNGTKDFDAPNDADTNNTYIVNVRATDSASNTADQTVTVTVTQVDTTPTAFSFVDVTDAALSTVYESNAIIVAGINTNSPLTITGGEYSINGAAYASSAVSVNLGDSIKVRGTSSSSNSTAVNVALTIGGVSDTYTITTVAAGASTAGEPIGLLLILTKAA